MWAILIVMSVVLGPLGLWQMIRLDRQEQRLNGAKCTRMTTTERNGSDVDEQTATLVADALLEAEWSNHGGGTRTCQGCHHSWAFPAEGHRKDCRVDAALTALGYPDQASRERRRTELWQADQVKRYGRVMVGG